MTVDEAVDITYGVGKSALSAVVTGDADFGFRSMRKKR
jgi:hypothetical protein